MPTKVIFSQCVTFYLDLDTDKKKQSSEFLLFSNYAYFNYFRNKKVNILFDKADVHFFLNISLLNMALGGGRGVSHTGEVFCISTLDPESLGAYFQRGLYSKVCGTAHVNNWRQTCYIPELMFIIENCTQASMVNFIIFVVVRSTICLYRKLNLLLSLFTKGETKTSKAI